MLALPTLVVMNAVSTPCRARLVARRGEARREASKAAEDTGRVYRTDSTSMMIDDPVVSCVVDHGQVCSTCTSTWLHHKPTTSMHHILPSLPHERVHKQWDSSDLKSERLHSTYLCSYTLILIFFPRTPLARQSNDNVQCSFPPTSVQVNKDAQEGTSASPP